MWKDVGDEWKMAWDLLKCAGVKLDESEQPKGEEHRASRPGSAAAAVRPACDLQEKK